MSDTLTADEIPWYGTPAGEPHDAPRPTLGGILRDLTAFLRTYVVVTDDQAAAIALWVAHTHLVAAAECTPYLQITSATKRAGKTRLLEVLEPLVARPWLTGRTSAAVLVRKTDAEHPTLLLDESDAAFNGEKDYAEALRGILNTGYRKSGKASLCIGQGANITYKDFSTFSPKAIAGIGELPGTVADRAIRIALQRRRQDEACARWRERLGHVEAEPLHAALVAWSHDDDVIGRLWTAEPALPSGLSDRQADCWEPLFAIADAAGESWSTTARKAAVALSGYVDDSDIVVELLTDIAGLLAETDDSVITTKALLDHLTADEDRPWATWRKGEKPITARGLARLLGPLGIVPTRIRPLRGYRRDGFEDAIARYLGSQVAMRHQPNENGPELPFSMWPSDPAVATCETQETAINTGLGDAWPHRNPDVGDRTLTDEKQDTGDERFRKGF